MGIPKSKQKQKHDHHPAPPKKVDTIYDTRSSGPRFARPSLHTKKGAHFSGDRAPVGTYPQVRGFQKHRGAFSGEKAPAAT